MMLKILTTAAFVCCLISAICVKKDERIGWMVAAIWAFDATVDVWSQP